MGSKYICNISKSQSYRRAFNLQFNIFPHLLCQWTSNFPLREANIKAPWAWERRSVHSEELSNTAFRKKPMRRERTQGEGPLPWSSTQRTALCTASLNRALQRCQMERTQCPLALSLHPPRPHSSVPFSHLDKFQATEKTRRLTLHYMGLLFWICKCFFKNL